MHFDLDGLRVSFPYDLLYQEQYEYMRSVKEALDGGGHCLLEIPPGSAKTVCLLSLITSYNNANAGKSGNERRRKLVYAINPIPEMRRVLEELEMVLNCRSESQKNQQQHNKNNNHNIRQQKQQKLYHGNNSNNKSNNNSLLALCLSGHDHECVDAACRHASSSRNNNGSTTHEPPRAPVRGVFFDLNQLRNWGSLNGWNDSKQLIRHAVNNADVLVVQYQYLLDPKVSKMISSGLLGQSHGGGGGGDGDGVVSSSAAGGAGGGGVAVSNSDTTTTNNNNNGEINNNNNGNKNNSNKNNTNDKNDTIVVFDQAHNIDGICMNALSVAVNSKCLDQATRSLGRLSSEITRIRDMARSSSVINAMDIDAILDGTTNNNNGNNHVVAECFVLDNEYKNLLEVPVDHGVYCSVSENNNVNNNVSNNNNNINNNNNNASSSSADNDNKKDKDSDSLPSFLHRDDVADGEPVSGNIRRAEHFIGFMKKIIEYYKARLRWLTPAGGVSNANSGSTGTSGKNETPLAFLHRMTNSTGLEAKALKFTYARLVSLLRTLKVSDCPVVDAGRKGFAGLLAVADLTSLLATYSAVIPAKFAIITDLNNNNAITLPLSGDHEDNLGTGGTGEALPTLQLACLDASLAIAPLFERFGTVILTSTTLSPIDFYPKLLQVEFAMKRSFDMSTFRSCVHPMVISRGSDQLAMSTKYEDRTSLSVIRNYGTMLVELCAVIPDGVVAYFHSYSYMESLVQEWDAMGIMRELTKSKLVFIETFRDLTKTTISLDNYRMACDCGRGGVFFAVARGKVSEGISFDSHYGRAAIMFGLPYQYTLSNVVRARVEYMKTYLEIREHDFLNFDAIRQTSNCLCKVIRSKIDYGLMILADSRFNGKEKKKMLPRWVLQFLPDTRLNLSTENAVLDLKYFLRRMGQPIDHGELRKVLVAVHDLTKKDDDEGNADADECFSSSQQPEGIVSSSDQVMSLESKA